MNIKIRIFLLFIGLLILYLGLGARLFHIQIRSHGRFDRMADNNYSVQIKKSSPGRGTIYDRHGTIIAMNKHTYSIGFNFSREKLSEEFSKEISQKLDISIKTLKKYSSDRSGFKWLARHVSPNKVQTLFKYKQDGLVITKENSRFYPLSKVASKVIGCVGTDNQGLSGIEYNFNKQLSEQAVNEEVFRDAKGHLMHLNVNPDESESYSLSNLRLTIDTNLQYIAERELKKGFKKFRPKWALAVIQDPTNGEILAIAEYPGFDPNKGVPSDMEELKIKAVSTIFEPGSTFKIVTAAAAIEETLIAKDQMIDCENGEYEVGGFPIRDFEPHKKLSFQDCMVHSSNIALAKIGARLGKKLLYKYARDFGFGNFSGIRLPGEPRGILRKPDRWSGTSLSRISFGQEIGVTAIQLITAFSAVANGGQLYEPRIVKQVEFKGGVRKFEPLPIRRVISKKTSEQLKEILHEVVKRGSGVQAQVKGYKIAGKTGTAQKMDPETQSYYENQYVAGFAGFFPVDDPKYTVLVVFDEPAVEYHWGGYVAAPVFSEIARAILNYANIAPTEIMK